MRDAGSAHHNVPTLARLWSRWTEPSTAIVDAGERRSARQLASLMLAIIPVGFISAAAQLLTDRAFSPVFFVIMGALLALAVTYRIGRTLQYRAAGVVAACVPIVAGGAVGLTVPGDPAWFAFMGLGTILASAFLGTRMVGMIGAATVVATAVVLSLTGRLAAQDGLAELGFSFMLATLVVLVTRHRAAMELARHDEVRESQALYRTLFEQAPIGISVTTPDGRPIVFNDTLPRQGGYSRKDLEQLTSVADLCYDVRTRTALMDQLGREGRVVAAEVRLRAKDGSPYDVSLSLEPITFEGQRCILGTVEDVSSRKRAEARHLEIAEFVDKSLSEVYVFDTDSLRFEYASEGACRNLGYTMEQVRTLTPLDLKPEYQETSFRALIAPLLRGETDLLVFETLHRRADATTYPVEVHLQLATRPGRRVALAVILDITARRQAETERERLLRELRAQEQRFKSLIGHSADIIALVGATADLQHLNPAFTAVLGHRAEDWLGKSILALVWPDDLPEAEALFAQTLAAPREVVAFQLRARHADGSFRWLEGTGTNYIDDPATGGIVLNGRDVTTRLRAEEVVRRNELRMRVALDTSDLAVFEMDRDLRYTWMHNPQMGYSPEQVIGRTDHELLGDDGLTVMDIKRRMLASGQRLREEVRVRRGELEATFDLTVEPLRSEAGVVVGLRGASLNITEAKAMHAQLVQSQKMETVGRLAGGIAHDFNNLLTVISGGAELATLQLRDSDPLRGDLEEIRHAAERAAELTRQLLAFSRKQVLQPAIVNLNTVVANVTKLLERLIGEDIALRLMPAEDLGNVKADPGQIEQVIVNLAVNARDAMPGGGSLTIETQNAAVGEALAQRLSLPPGPYVRLAVSDTGTGMDQETLQQIFEPFFTTKVEGKGTGLGLSTVYGIVKQSGGGIWADSEVGKGCTFNVYLPRVAGTAHARKAAPHATVTPGTETILVVEDEALIRRLAVKVLAAAGYRVIEAASGGQALELVQRHDGPIDLMMTDVVMPGMSGLELADLLAKSHPRTRVIFSSGFMDDTTRERAAATHFIGKPYTITELTRRVREVLDAPGHRPGPGGAGGPTG